MLYLEPETFTKNMSVEVMLNTGEVREPHLPTPIPSDIYLCANDFAKCATNLFRNMNAIGITWLILIFP